MAYYGGTATERPWPKINANLVALLVLFLVFIVASSFLAANLMAPQPQEIVREVVVAPEVNPEKPVAIPVVIASENIWPGQRLESTSFRIEPRMVEGSEDSIVTDLTAVEGVYASATIIAGSPVFKDSITLVPPTNALTARIPKGHRAVAIPVDAESAVEGWARAGAKVDVIWSTTHRGRMLVTTIVESAQVLSAGRSLGKGPDGRQKAEVAVPNHVTLLVPIKDAQRIQLAKTSGKLSLNLRGDEDSADINAGTLTIEKLFRPGELDALGDQQSEVVVRGKRYRLLGRNLVPLQGPEPKGLGYDSQGNPL